MEQLSVVEKERLVAAVGTEEVRHLSVEFDEKFSEFVRLKRSEGTPLKDKSEH